VVLVNGAPVVEPAEGGPGAGIAGLRK